MLRSTDADCAVFQAGKRVAGVGASDEVNRWRPLPLSVAWRLRQASARAWLAMAARRSGSTELSDSRVVTTAIAAGRKQRAQADAEGEARGFFHLTAGETAAGVVAAVGCVEHDDEAGCGRGRCLCGCGQGKNEDCEQGGGDAAIQPM